MIARKSALIIAIQFANGILGYIGLKFIAMYMEPWEYGVIGFAWGFVALFEIIGVLGFDQAHIKRVSEGQDLGSCIATFASVKLVLTGVLAATVIGVVGIWRYIVGRGFESPVHEQAVYVMLAYFMLLTLTHTMKSTFQAKKEIAKTYLPLFAYNLVRIAATIYVTVGNFGVLALAYTYVIGEFFQFLFSLYLFKGYSVTRPSFTYLKSYYRFAVNMALVIFSWKIITNVDKVFIQLFWTAEQVGEYFAVFNLSRFLLLFASSVGMLLFPTLSAYHAKNDMESIRRLVVSSERWLSMVATPLVIMMVVLADPVIRILLSNRYLPALPVLQILPFFVLIEILSRPYESQLQGMNMPQITRNRFILMMLVNVALNLVLIPRDIKSLNLTLAGMGASGAALATVIAYLIGMLYVRAAALRITGLRGTRTVFVHFLAGAATGGILYVIEGLIPTFRFYSLAAVFLAGLGIYFAILYLIREFTREDFGLFMDTLNIKKMLGYIRDEIRRK